MLQDLGQVFLLSEALHNNYENHDLLSLIGWGTPSLSAQSTPLPLTSTSTPQASGNPSLREQSLSPTSSDRGPWHKSLGTLCSDLHRSSLKMTSLND